MSEELFFHLNGAPVKLVNPDPEWTLLQYLRKVGLTGTKLGCGEGGCGACTVLVSSFDAATKTVSNLSVNACLAPLCSMDGRHVITIEGIGNSKQPHPVQERIARFHGSQCGFCTPGIAMALYALLRNKPNPTEEEIEHAFDGNLCRCTGYRPILDAAKTFSKPSSCEGCANGDCKSNCAYVNAPTGCGVANCCQLNNQPDEDVDAPTVSKIQFKAYDPTQELIFPPALMNYALNGLSSLAFSNDRCQWFRPVTFGELLNLKTDYPAARLIGGNTEVGVEFKLKRMRYPVLIYIGDIPELQSVTIDDNGIVFGANITLTKFWKTLDEAITDQSETQTQTFKALVNNLQWFAGKQIRNVATLAGNICTASPISDLNPILVASRAVVLVASATRGEREIPMTDFFLGYRKTALAPDEVLLTVSIPFTRPNEYVRSYKQAKRKDDDIAIANAGIRVQLDDELNVQECVLAFGGMGPTTVQAKQAAANLVGKHVGDADAWEYTLRAIVQTDLPLQRSTPGGMPAYRMALAASFLYRFHQELKLLLHMSKDERGNVDEIKRGLSKGTQDHSKLLEGDNKVVGRSVMHLSAMKQVTGEAIYTDDIPLQARELYAAPVFTTKPHAKIIQIDPTEALNMPGVHRFFGAKDVPGDNMWGPVRQDEPVFVDDVIVSTGQFAGIIVADSQLQAQEAAWKVKVVCEDLQPILTIEEAIQHESYIDPLRQLERGDLAAGFAASDHIFTGEMRMGGQEQFYLETQGCLVIPKEDEIEIFSSTQNAHETQLVVAHTLHIPANRVVCRVKRLGGGFGGKESRSIPLAAAVSVAAYHMKRPIRCMLDRDEDMMHSGQRHPFLGKYKIGVDKDGKIQALDAEFYCNAGYSADLTFAVLERAMTHVDNTYYIPNTKVTGRVCRTNTPSNTAFRGFGGPQGMIVTEAMMSEVADKLNMSQETFREINFYKAGQATHFNQTLTDWHFPTLWKDLLVSSEYEERRAQVDAFNTTSTYKKRGLCIIPTKYGLSFTARFLNQAGALVHIYTDGSVLLTHGGVEMGQGLHTKMAQVCAEELQTNVENVFISETATNTVANTSATAASVSSDLNGAAIKNACDQLNERLAPFRHQMPDASLAQLAKAAYFERVNLSANGFYRTPDLDFDWDKNEGQMYFYFTTGAAVTEVELDVLSGDHTILRTDIKMDIGKSLNYAIDIGQIEGAFIQGVGWCTLEETLFFPNGNLFTKGPGNYKLPGFRDIPQDFRVSLLKNAHYEHLKTIQSSKGIGEPPLFLGSSVLFALRDAVKAARREFNNDQVVTLTSPATAERLRLAVNDFISDMAKEQVAVKEDERDWVVMI